MEPILIGAALTFPLVAIRAAFRTGPVPGVYLRSARWAWAGLASAILLAAAVAVAGPMTLFLGSGVASWRADELAVVVVLVSCLINATVQTFGLRYLADDPSARRFSVTASAVTASGVALALSATVAGLVTAWLLGSIATWALLGHRRDLDQARAGRQMAARAFVVGDLALVAGAGLLMAVAGNVELAELPSHSARITGAAITLGGLEVGVAPIVGAAVVVAALARAAQFPARRWLSMTLMAPTPVSAMLHAGVVNAGGILLIRMAPVTGLSPLPGRLALAVGLTTIGLATAAMTVRADTKSVLVHSTSAQMGFMICQCAVGALGPALVHLAGHAMFKAALFLDAGSGVGRPHPEDDSGQIRRLSHRLALTVAIMATAAIMATGVAGALSITAGPVVAVFAAAAVGNAVWGWSGRARWRATEVAVVGGAAAVAVAAYLGFVAGVERLVPLPAGHDLVGFPSPWWLLAAIAVPATVALGRVIPCGSTLALRAYATAASLAAPPPARPVEPLRRARVDINQSAPAPAALALSSGSIR